MSVERFIWKLIKRLVRAQRERDDWEARCKSAAVKVAEPEPNIVTAKERAIFLDIVARLSSVGDALGRVDREHPLSPELASRYRDLLYNAQLQIQEFVATHKGFIDD